MADQTVNPFAPPETPLDSLPPGLSEAAVALATRASRLGASMLDALCFLPVGIIVAIFMFLARPASDGSNQPPPVAIALAAVAGLYVIGYVVLQIYLLSTRGQTLGKKWIGIKIVKMNGSAPGFVHAFLLRSFVSGLIGAVPYLGYAYSLVDILFIFRDDRRCVHDLIAGTRVVRA
jgi:uncharacterized RDD family membrane protein YckC